MPLALVYVAVAVLQNPGANRFQAPATRADTLAMIELASAALRDKHILVVGGHLSAAIDAFTARLATDRTVLRAVADSLGLGVDTKWGERPRRCCSPIQSATDCSSFWRSTPGKWRENGNPRGGVRLTACS